MGWSEAEYGETLVCEEYHHGTDRTVAKPEVIRAQIDRYGLCQANSSGRPLHFPAISSADQNGKIRMRFPQEACRPTTDRAGTTDKQHRLFRHRCASLAASPLIPFARLPSRRLRGGSGALASDVLESRYSRIGYVNAAGFR